MIARAIKAKALVFAVFFLGIGAGILIANFYTTRVTGSREALNPPDRTQRAQRDIRKFYDYLGLDDGQRQQMRKIGEETRGEFQKLREETQPRYQAIQERSRAKIRAVLNDEQRAKYDDFRRQIDERRRNRNPNGNARPPGADGGPRPN